MMTREKYLKKYFTNISLNIEYPDLFYVRNSILSSIKDNLSKFKGVVLDVGCGIMPYREIILNSNKRVTSYIGLDFENSIHPEYELGKPDFFWNGDEIPKEDGSVDTIIATEFFEHCPQPEKVMVEMLRVLKPEGVLYLTVPFLWNLHIVPYDEYRYTPFSLERHLINAGFVDIKLTSLGGLDASLAQMIGIWLHQRPMRKIYKKILSFFFFPIMKWLIKKDSKVNQLKLFTDGAMITGISGTAMKKSNAQSFS
jgi:SAM-dependent methyltransferase